MLNIAIVQGRLVKDPERRQTQSGKTVCQFRVACDRGRKDAQGNSLTDWIDVVAWEHTAEFVCKYFQKGSLILVNGRIETRNYQDRNGNNRTAVEIVANGVDFCGSKSTQGNNPPAAEKPAESRLGGAEYEVLDADADLPF